MIENLVGEVVSWLPLLVSLLFFFFRKPIPKDLRLSLIDFLKKKEVAEVLGGDGDENKNEAPAVVEKIVDLKNGLCFEGDAVDLLRAFSALFNSVRSEKDPEELLKFFDVFKKEREKFYD